MKLELGKSLAAAGSLWLVLGLYACKAKPDYEQQPPEQKPVEWKISWTPTITHEDNTPITTQPTYELEMAEDENAQGPWRVIWSGPSTTAVFEAPPGRRCFRAVTVENGVRSRPSEANCATKSAEGASE